MAFPPPLWLIFDSWTWHQMWVEFVIGSHPYLMVFVRVLRFYPCHKKQNSKFYIYTWKQRTRKATLGMCIVKFFYYHHSYYQLLLHVNQITNNAFSATILDVNKVITVICFAMIALCCNLQLCGKGYTRAPDNTSCVLCNCFDHSEDCDGESGECYSCLHNTTGKVDYSE